MEKYNLLEGKDVEKIYRILTKEFNEKTEGCYLYSMIDKELINEYSLRTLVFEYKQMYYGLENNSDFLLGLNLKINDFHTDSFATLSCITQCKSEYVDVIKEIFMDFSELFSEYTKIVCYVNLQDVEKINYIEKIGFEKEAVLTNECGNEEDMILYSYFLQ